jgi:hypothetical protein
MTILFIYHCSFLNAQFSFKKQQGLWFLETKALCFAAGLKKIQMQVDAGAALIGSKPPRMQCFSSRSFGPWGCLTDMSSSPGLPQIFAAIGS